MTFKTEKGQLAYQFLTGITICLWVWFFLLTVAVEFLPSMDTGGDIVNTESHVFYGGLAHNGKEYHAIAYSVAVRTVEDEVVDWNIAVFPFNYDEETYKKLDNFE